MGLSENFSLRHPEPREGSRFLSNDTLFVACHSATVEIPRGARDDGKTLVFMVFEQRSAH